MSDQSTFITPTLGGDSFATLRDNAEAGLGKARLRTIVSYTSGPQTLVSGTVDEVWCAGTFTVNLPASPADGESFDFLQTTNAATLTIGRNGKQIDGASSDTTLVGSTTNVWKTLKWSAGANTWRTRS